MKKIIIIAILFLGGCRTGTYEIPLTQEHYQYLEKGQEFTVPNDGHYYSKDGLNIHDNAVIFRHEMRGLFK